MRRLILIALSLTAILSPAAPALAAPKKKPTPKPAVTKANLQNAQLIAKPFSAWDDSFKKVVDSIGKPGKVDGTKNYWYAKDGSTCSELEVDKMNDSVGATSLNDYDQTKQKDLYARCDVVK